MNNYLYFIRSSCRLKSLHFKKVLFPKKKLSMVSVVPCKGQAFGGLNCYLRKNAERGVTTSSADFQRRKNMQIYGYKWPRFCFVLFVVVVVVCFPFFLCCFHPLPTRYIFILSTNSHHNPQHPSYHISSIKASLRW